MNTLMLCVYDLIIEINMFDYIFCGMNKDALGVSMCILEVSRSWRPIITQRWATRGN